MDQCFVKQNKGKVDGTENFLRSQTVFEPALPLKVRRLRPLGHRHFFLGSVAVPCFNLRSLILGVPVAKRIKASDSVCELIAQAKSKYSIKHSSTPQDRFDEPSNKPNSCESSHESKVRRPNFIPATCRTCFGRAQRIKVKDVRLGTKRQTVVYLW
ncbi:hypothetical protein J6590_033525 [Homalodisca vitripennis]|nr:hypothetical protein J6590_033525 [Homalodisca vitripennis]